MGLRQGRALGPYSPLPHDRCSTQRWASCSPFWPLIRDSLQQGTVVFTTQVPTLGRYAFLLHSYQPVHPSFPVEVLINGGRIWQGE